MKKLLPLAIAAAFAFNTAAVMAAPADAPVKTEAAQTQKAASKTEKTTDHTKPKVKKVKKAHHKKKAATQKTAKKKAQKTTEQDKAKAS